MTIRLSLFFLCLLSTKVLTPKNEYVTVPNAVLISGVQIMSPNFEAQPEQPVIPRNTGEI